MCAIDNVGHEGVIFDIHIVFGEQIQRWFADNCGIYTGDLAQYHQGSSALAHHLVCHLGIAEKLWSFLVQGEQVLNSLTRKGLGFYAVPYYAGIIVLVKELGDFR